MKLRQAVAVFAAAAIPITFATSAAAAPGHGAAPAAARPPASSSRVALDECSAAYFQGDPRLGPARLPVRGPVGRQLFGYRRTGGMSVPHFLAIYWNPAADGGQGGWIYPPNEGFVIGPHHRPVEFPLRLEAGLDIDRYGSPYGMFLSPEGDPFPSRALPPQSLDGTPPAGCNYHDYRVIRSFRVEAGPVAPWFGQPGQGLQYVLDPALIPGAPPNVNVLWLITNGYLEPLAR